MDLLTAIIAGLLLALFTAIQTWINKGRFDTLERRLEAHEQSNERHFEQVERRFEQLGDELAQLRSDLLQVALASRPPHPQTG